MSFTYCFSIPDIYCPTCVNAVNQMLQPSLSFWEWFTDFFSITKNTASRYKKISLDGKSITLKQVQVNLATKQISVTTDDPGLTPLDVMNLLNVELDALGFSCSEMTSPAPISSSKINDRWFLGGAGVLAGVALLILPFITGPLSLLTMTIIAVPSIALTVALGFESYKKAAKLLFNGGHLHMDTLFAISSLTAMVASIVALFIPGLPMMFEAGLLIFGFRHIGEAIRESLEQKMALNERFQDRAPKQVYLVRDGVREEVPLGMVNLHDLILIQAGGVIPLDGVYDTGEGTLDRSIENGNKDPVQIKSGDKISAGTLLISGEISMRVTALANDSLLARKDASIARSLSEKDETSWKTEADKALRYFIPMVFGLAILAGIVVACFFPPALAIQSVVAVLVSACPCTLGLVTGMAIQVGMKKAADHHVAFKSTRKLEEIDQVDHIGLDLNGTLTTTEPEVCEAVHCKDSSCSYEDFLNYALMLETGSNKAVGIAIYEYASKKISSVDPAFQALELDKSNHSGVKATLDGVTYVIGNHTLMRHCDISIDSYVHRRLKSDETIMYLARDKEILGHFVLKRPLRTEAKSVVTALKKMGKQVHIFTGADEETALGYADELGIQAPQVHFNMTAEDKVQRIRALQANRTYRVAMIGDEENDADALVASDFGVAMPTDGRGNMNRHIADAEFKINSLEPIVAAFEISKQTSLNIQQNLIFSWSYNIAALLLPVLLLVATGFALTPGVGVALMILQTCLILLNTYWFKHQELVCLKEAREEGQPIETESYGAMSSMMPTSNHQTEPTQHCSHDTTDREEIGDRAVEPCDLSFDAYGSSLGTSSRT